MQPRRRRAGFLHAAWLAAVAGSWHAAGAEAPPATPLDRLGLQESAVAARDMPGWHTPRRVVVLMPREEFGDASGPLAELRGVAGSAEVIAVETPAEVLAKIAEADVLLGFCTPEFVAAGKALRWIQHYYVGVERCVGAPGLKQRQILLTNGKQLAGPPIAEHVIALMLGLSRNLPRFAHAQQRAEWNQDPSAGMWELQGKTLLVAGLGGIGTEVAARAHALGMRVIATRGSSREGPDYVDYVGLADELNTLAAQADVVVNCTPLTPATTGIFDSAFFRQMKRGGYFISIGRGQSTVTADLVAALRSGQLAGAGLDVTDPEPLPSDSPLWSMENVIITPHVAGGSDLSSARTWALVRENLRRYVAGERMLNVVDLDKGY